MKTTVYLCGMGMTEEECALANKIGGVLRDKAKEQDKEINVIIHDVEVHGDADPEVAILFGNVIGIRTENKSVYHAPKLSRMMSVNEDVNALKMRVMEFIDEIVSLLPAEEDQTKQFVETPEGITVGGIGADIQITEKEAEHLKKIKDILGGGKMVIQKGDLRIEVEPNE
jgi:hypothetical protein